MHVATRLKWARRLEFPIRSRIYEIDKRWTSIVLGNPDTLERGLEPLEDGQRVYFDTLHDRPFMIRDVRENVIHIYDFDLASISEQFGWSGHATRLIRPTQWAHSREDEPGDHPLLWWPASNAASP